MYGANTVRRLVNAVMGGIVKLLADNSVCEGHGQCAMVDDELFVLDDDGYIALGGGVEVAPEQEQAARLGVGACPVRALRVSGSEQAGAGP